MTGIVLSGFDCVSENGVYSRDKLLPCDDGELPCREVLTLGRYVEPSEDAVIDYLIKRAEETGPSADLALPEGVRVKGKDDIETILKSLPGKVIRDFASKDGGLMKFLRKKTPAMPLKEGVSPDTFLRIMYGILPAQIIDENREAGNIEDDRWYDHALSDDRIRTMGLGLEYNIKLVVDNDALPSLEDVGFLLRHRVSDSRTFVINRRNYNKEAVWELLEDVYDALPRDSVRRVRDLSEDALKEVSIPPLLALLKFVKEASERQGQGRPGGIRLSFNGQGG